MKYLSICLLLMLAAIPKSWTMDQGEKDKVLALHNQFRRATAKGETVDAKGTAQDKAADMSEMIWDSEAEAAAQAWVDTCPMPGPHGHEEQLQFGENIAWGAPVDRYPVEKLTTLWYEEVTKKPGELFGSPSKFTMSMVTKGVGHYTTMMYAKSQKLGCANKVCEGKHVLVCRYLLAGNIDDEPIYTVGEPCSACASGQTCSDGLCKGGPWDCSGDPSYCPTYGECDDSFVIEACPTKCGQC